jgi:uroporphyrinogen III methyltransferase / synthase
VPGITAGIGAAAYAGIPVTHRGLATAVAFVTGHTLEEDNEGEPALDWAALAAFPGTLVFYMGVRQLPAIARSLIASGRDPGEAAAVVESGTLADQRTVTGTLETIAGIVARKQVRPPSITIVGAVTGLAEQLDWLPARPLHGVTIAVTRARAQSSGLARRLRDLGAQVVQAPAIEVRPLPGPPLDPSPYDLICVTSANGVEHLFERLAAGDPPRDARALAHATIAAIGPGTARALAAHGIHADVVPERFVAEALVEALSGLSVERALVARPARARDALPEALTARGAAVDVLELYETVPCTPPPQVLEAALAADYATFTSSSTVRYYLDAIGGPERLLGHTRIASIGPVTSETLREHGLEPHLEADRHDIDGLIDALLADVAAAKAAGG